MKLTDRPKWKKIVIAVVCIAALLTAVSSSYAAYTSQAYKRGVARNRDNETVRFTSNYLQNCAAEPKPSEYAGRTILFEESEKEKDTLTIDLDIYNYANGNLNLVSQKDITYKLQVSFSGGDGKGYSVTYDENVSASTTDSVTYTINERTLTGRTANQHHYVLSFPGKELDKLKITVTATPVPVSVNNGQILAAVIAPCTGSSTNAFSFEGKYTDESESTTPQDYSGFNYEISISSGSATATLKWKSDVLEVDQFFITKIAGSISKQTDGSLTFTMDQPNGTGDYLIPFYIKDKSKVPENWAGMKELITFSAKQSETATAN